MLDQGPNHLKLIQDHTMHGNSNSTYINHLQLACTLNDTFLLCPQDPKFKRSLCRKTPYPAIPNNIKTSKLASIGCLMPHPVKLTLNLAVEDTQIFAPSIPPKDRVKDDPD